MSEFCTFEESQDRLEVCKQCDSFVIDETGTRCTSADADCAGACSISLLVSHKDKTCPEGKW